MDSRDFASDSDDEDFVPSGALLDDDSGSDVTIEDEAADEQSEDVPKTKKRRKGSSNFSKRQKKRVDELAAEEKTETPEKSEEEKKKHADSLWADFLSDVKPKSKRSNDIKPTERGSNSAEERNSNDREKNVAEGKSTETKPQKERSSIEKLFQEKENKAEKDDIQVFEFAGETVRVECQSNRKSVGGVAGFLEQLKRKGGKLSALEKSKLDWESFKAKEGIDEDIRSHNKGRHGYLGKQDFLERADLRQFEIEKGMRAATRRSKR